MPGTRPPAPFDARTWLALAVVTAAAYVTYFRGFNQPALPIWDEMYHIVSAQKYLHGVYFVELHPPLGKLLIALGEWLIGENAVTSQFLDVTYWATAFPPDFSYVGYRFVPVLLAWLTAPILFGVFLTMTGRRLLAMLLSGLYVFDNALVVHLRSAMLEGPLLFFGAVTLLAFVRFTDVPALGRWRDRWLFLAMGAAFGGMLATKALGLLFVVLPAVAVWRAWVDRRRAGELAAVVCCASAAVFFGSWEAHFALARHVNPALMNDGFYQTPAPAARAFLVDSHDRWPVRALPALLGEAFRYSRWYDRSRPALNVCRADEKGSPFWMWPIGARAVSYQWLSSDGGQTWRYLYLQSNPVVWWTALAGVFAAVALLVMSIAWPRVWVLRRRFLLAVVAAMYCGYFLQLPFIHGVMFLYHYFIPLVLSFVLLALVVDEVLGWDRTPASRWRGRAALSGWFAAVVLSFWFYSPLTYFQPLTDLQVQQRAWVGMWDLACLRCPRSTGLCPPSP